MYNRYNYVKKIFFLPFKICISLNSNICLPFMDLRHEFFCAFTYSLSNSNYLKKDLNVAFISSGCYKSRCNALHVSFWRWFWFWYWKIIGTGNLRLYNSVLTPKMHTRYFLPCSQFLDNWTLNGPSLSDNFQRERFYSLVIWT